ncbi:Alpha/Beta hydrolase protein [Nemania sp. FL0916]|nr:Alpha/Beta hydrolase protein [Nemania sp. FL0916]
MANHLRLMRLSKLHSRVYLQPLSSRQLPLLASMLSPSRSISRRSMASSTSSSTQARRDSQTLRLPDGRVLGFAEYGSPTGKPVFFFHGFPSSRLEAAGILKLAPRPDVRIIAPERPGFGLSTFDPTHRVADWPAAVSALAAHLDIPQFAILGGSGGAPYALACARALPPEMISTVGLLAPAAPWTEGGIAGVPVSSRIAASMGYYWPASLQAVTAGIVGIARWLVATSFVTRRIDAWIEASRKSEAEAEAKKHSELSTTTAPSTHSSSPSPPATAPTPDKPSTAETRTELIRSVFEAFQQGTAPLVRESQLLTWTGWGLPLDEMPDNRRIVIWHGTADGQSPIAMVRDLARRLGPRCCELRELEGETHFTLASAEYLGQVLEELVPEEEEGGGEQPGKRT